MKVIQRGFKLRRMPFIIILRFVRGFLLSMHYLCTRKPLVSLKIETPDQEKVALKKVVTIQEKPPPQLQFQDGDTLYFSILSAPKGS